MNRTHVKNPTVTLIMETIGGHQDKIARAIRSCIAQTYPVTLLVINTHPQRLEIKNLPDTADVDILNVEDIFKRPVEQHSFSIKRVNTDCWSILDDDDAIEPHHVEQLVSLWNAQDERTNAPLQVCIPLVIADYGETKKVIRTTGWMNSLFERLSPEEVDLVYRNFPQDRICGSDNWIAGNTYFDRRMGNGKPTYLWDRIGNSHISSHETRRGDTLADKYWYSLNYWKLKLAARSTELKPVEL